MRPLIGITMNLEERSGRSLNCLDQDYARAVEQAGGIPVPVAGITRSIPELVKKLDGFLFTGGDDIHPRHYHERPLPGANLRLDADGRVNFELRLFRAAAKARKPVLAVCYGAQLVNVALGGTLYQDIGRQVKAALRHGTPRTGEKVHHQVKIFEGTKLCSVLGDCSKGDRSLRVRSAHHQSVKNPGRGLRLAAASADGVYEALESRGKTFLIAVQWHPEKTPTDRATKRLFAALVAASRK